jgi:NADH dehydrogenase (ubiquinone) 1 alpha subcomplex subunit 13
LVQLKFDRIFPVRGPSGFQLWFGSALVIAYGFHTVGKTNHKRAHQKVEERRMRYAITPYLQAESERKYLLREEENLRLEREIMSDVKDWKVGESWYHNKRFVKRAVNPLKN